MRSGRMSSPMAACMSRSILKVPKFHHLPESGRLWQAWAWGQRQGAEFGNHAPVTTCHTDRSAHGTRCPSRNASKAVEQVISSMVSGP